MRRVVSAREQAELLSPWRVAADAGDIIPGGGPSSVISSQPQGAAVPDEEWVNQDWRNASDGGAFQSKVRPQMSSDIPHPVKVLDPSNKRNQKTLAHVMSSEDPDNDPWNVLGGTGVSFEDLVNNHLSHLGHLDSDQDYAGRVWYRAAHEATKTLSDRTVGDHGRVVHTMSAFSPKTDWDENLEKGHHFLTHYDGENVPVIPGMQGPVGKAVSIYHAPDGEYQNVNRGAKTSAFANNILDKTPLRDARPGVEDDAGYYDYGTNSHTGEKDWRLAPDQDVTIDTHHVRMANTPHGADLQHLRYETPDHFGKKITVNGKTYDPSYDLYSRAAWEATRRHNAAQSDPSKHLLPKQSQAGPWTKFKADLDRTNGKTPTEPGQAPKSWPKNPSPENIEKWKGQHPLTEPFPRYQRGQGDWIDPRRPELDMRKAPGKGRRRGFRLASNSLWWDSTLNDFIARHPQHPIDRELHASREVLAWVDRLFGGR